MIDPRRAARLTLLAVRGCVPRSRQFRDGVVRIGHRGPILTAAEAIDELARRAKPVSCYAEVESGVLVVNVSPWTWPMRDDGLSSDMLREWYRERCGDEHRHAAILCIADHDWTIATFDELESWERDYPFLGQVGFSLGELEERRRDLPADALAAARRLNAVAVHDYRRPAYDIEPEKPPVSIARIEPPADGGPCARCVERPARYVVQGFDDVTARRALCQRCIDEELEPSEFDQGRQLDRDRRELTVAEATKSERELAEIAEELAMTWALRTKPPFVAAFIARHRA